MSVKNQPATPDKKTIVVFMVVAGVLVVIGLGCVGSSLGVYYLLDRIDEPSRVALEHTKSNRQVIDRLGTPITRTWANALRDVRGNIAKVQFEIAGPDGFASIDAQLVRSKGDWRVLKILVTFNDGFEIHILPSDLKMSSQEAH